jgi:hypothetical protein
MRQCVSGPIRIITDPKFNVFLIFSLVVLAVFPAFAQTQQPFLFASTVVNASRLRPATSLCSDRREHRPIRVYGQNLGRCLPGTQQRNAGHIPDRFDAQRSGASVEPAFHSSRRIRRSRHRPKHHFIDILTEQANPPYSPLGVECGISFDLATGLPVSNGAGFCGSAPSSGFYPMGFRSITAGR